MAIDRDGTQGFVRSTTSEPLIQLSVAQLGQLNDEASTDLDGVDYAWLVLIFPERRDIDGFHLNAFSTVSQTFYVEVSADSTNGTDGTWTQIATGPVPPYQQTVPVVPGYRDVDSSTALAQRAIRVRFSSKSRLRAFHVYGEPAPGENPNRLALWHPTLDERIPPAYLDWGNVPRASSGDRDFRVKNLSGDMTAASIRVAMETLTDGTPSIPGQHALSYQGGSFLAQVNVGDLAPGAISAPVTLRRITPSNAQLGVWAFRVFAEADSWS